jgi:hypothetical protein
MDVKLTAHIDVVLRLRMSGTVPLLQPCVFMT